MAIQIIEENRKPTFSEKLNMGMNAANRELKQFNETRRKQKQLENEDKSLKSQGLDLSGVYDPELRKEIAKEHFKLKGKESLYAKKQSFLSQLFGGGQQGNPQDQMQPNGIPGQNPQGTQPQGQFGGINPLNFTDAQILEASAIDPDMARQMRSAKDSALEQQRYDEKLKHDKFKFGYETNKDYINKVTDAYQGSQEMDMKLDQMLSLKDLPTPALATSMEFLGLPPSLFSADAETAEKLSIDLTKNIQQFYGSRILQSEFGAFLKSIPTLKNTPEGRRRIAQNMKMFNRLKSLEYEKMRGKELDSEATGKPLSPSFRRDVMDRMKKEADQLSNEFKEANLKSAPLKRMKVKKGTRISDEMIDKYIMDAKGDVALAEKNAREDNYDIE